MKILATIVEYNPFHNGHKYHLEKSLDLTKATHSIALMSGSFVQRGEPAIVDKWTRAKMAVDNGIDLVLELPFIYSCQSAEFFALGAIGILDSLNLVDYLSFGSELGNLEALKQIADLLVDEPVSFKKSLKAYLDKGDSFPVSRSKALLEELIKDNSLLDYPYEDILKGSNNILAIEYLKSLKKLDSSITPITVERLGPNYKDYTTEKDIASATGIRNLVLNHSLNSVERYVPYETYQLLEEFMNRYGDFNSLKNYESIIRFLLISKDKEELRSILDIGEGLENRIVSKSTLNKDITKLIDSIRTKRYPATRIQRILMHLLMDLDGETTMELYGFRPQYIRVLAANHKGLEILSQVKKSSEVSIITKYAHYKNMDNHIINSFLYYEEKATNIFFSGLDTEKLKLKEDYYRSPYIK